MVFSLGSQVTLPCPEQVDCIVMGARGHETYVKHSLLKGRNGQPACANRITFHVIKPGKGKDDWCLTASKPHLSFVFTLQVLASSSQIGFFTRL